MNIKSVLENLLAEESAGKYPEDRYSYVMQKEYSAIMKGTKEIYRIDGTDESIRIIVLIRGLLRIGLSQIVKTVNQL